MEKSAPSMLFSRRAALRIRQLREDRKWSRERLAQELARVGQASLGANGIYKVEQFPDPTRRLTVDELGALAVVFETTPQAVMDWDNIIGLDLLATVGRDRDEDDTSTNRENSGVPMSPEYLAEIKRVARETVKAEFDRLRAQYAAEGWPDPDKAATHHLASEHFQEFGAPWEEQREDG